MLSANDTHSAFGSHLLLTASVLTAHWLSSSLHMFVCSGLLLLEHMYVLLFRVHHTRAAQIKALSS